MCVCVRAPRREKGDGEKNGEKGWEGEKDK